MVILFQFMFILFQAMNMILMILLSVLVNNNDSCEGLTVSLQKDINLKLFFIFLSLFWTMNFMQINMKPLADDRLSEMKVARDIVSKSCVS